MTSWLYIKTADDDSDQQCSVSEQELIRLLQSGQFTRQTLVWREGMDNWQPVQDIAALVPHLVIYADCWRRYFARIVDLWWEYTLTFSLFIILTHYINVPFEEYTKSWTSLFILLLLIFPVSTIIVDSACYWLFKQTPGKYITNMLVTNKTGEPVNTITYFKRNVCVYFLAMGCNLPLLAPIAMIVQALYVAEKKHSWYDQKLSLEVRIVKPANRSISVMKIIAVLVIFCLLILSLLTFLIILFFFSIIITQCIYYHHCY